MARSIVEYFADHEGYKCGYCKGEHSSLSHGMWAHVLTVEDYQDLIDRGWRRSGQYCYKPTMNRTCCPQYTIKCLVEDFKISKSQKKVLKSVHKYINAGKRSGSEEIHQKMQTDSVDRGAASAKTEEKNVLRNKKEMKTPQPGVGPDPSRPPCKKAKLLRLEKKKEKIAQKMEHGAVAMETELEASSSKKSSNQPLFLEQLLQELTDEKNPKHKFEIRLVRSKPRSPEFEASFKESYQVYKKYQMMIHGDPEDKPTERQYTRFLVDSPLKIRLVRSSPPSKEFVSSWQESYEVYKKYQIQIHQDDPSECDQRTFERFLCESPLQEKHIPGGLECGYGSFHQQYLLDGKIIAVGVIDILPHCTSSVYLYYDPDYSFMSLGTYSALREIEFTRSLRAKAPELKYYYMGFYIHSCPKMKYKGQYKPSFLLCPETYTWLPVEQCAQKLDISKYSRLEPTDKGDLDGFVDFEDVLVLHKTHAMPYAVYRVINEDSDDAEEVNEYASLVGKKCYQRMLLYRS